MQFVFAVVRKQNNHHSYDVSGPQREHEGSHHGWCSCEASESVCSCFYTSAASRKTVVRAPVHMGVVYRTVLAWTTCLGLIVIFPFTLKDCWRSSEELYANRMPKQIRCCLWVLLAASLWAELWMKWHVPTESRVKRGRGLICYFLQLSPLQREQCFCFT